jgi:hypothetical protein
MKASDERQAEVIDLRQMTVLAELHTVDAIFYVRKIVL